MADLNAKKNLILLLHAFVGWAFCAAIMGIGMNVTSMKTTLIIHAIFGPIGFAIITFIYFQKFNYTSSAKTALTFVAFVIFVDFFVVALLIQRSLDMFKSALGTWIPFALIFLLSYLVGLVSRKKPES